MWGTDVKSKLIELFTNYLRTIGKDSCYNAGQMVYENKYRSWFTVKHYGITFWSCTKYCDT